MGELLGIQQLEFRLFALSQKISPGLHETILWLKLVNTMETKHNYLHS